MRSRWLINCASVGFVAVAYFVGAKLGLRLAFVAEQVSAVWPPSGIALLIRPLRVFRLIARAHLLEEIDGQGDRSLI